MAYRTIGALRRNHTDAIIDRLNIDNAYHTEEDAMNANPNGSQDCEKRHLFSQIPKWRHTITLNEFCLCGCWLC